MDKIKAIQMKFFKGKSNKENEPTNSRCSSIRYKSSNSSTVGSEYNERFMDQQNFYQPRAIYVSSKSPYSVITEPKTTKSSRSEPGGLKSTKGRDKQRGRLSPPDYISQNKRNFSHMHDVSGCYENFPPQKMVVHLDHIENSKSHKHRNNDYNSRQLTQYPGSSRHKGSLSKYGPQLQHSGTSEYGSADPSPTNQYPLTGTIQRRGRAGSNIEITNNHTGRRNAAFFNENNSFDSTDYDSDSDAMPSNREEILQHQLKELTEKCKEYKKKLRFYKSKQRDTYEEKMQLEEELNESRQHMNKLTSELNKERNNYLNLKRQLDLANDRIKSICASYNNNPLLQHHNNINPLFYGSQTQPISHQIRHQAPNLFENQATYPNFTQLSLPSQQIYETEKASGAGEAMVSRTDMNFSHTFNNHSEDKTETPRNALSDFYNGSHEKFSPIVNSQKPFDIITEEDTIESNITIEQLNNSEETTNSLIKSTNKLTLVDSMDLIFNKSMEIADSEINNILPLRRSLSETDVANIVFNDFAKVEEECLEDEAINDEEDKKKSIKICTSRKIVRGPIIKKRFKKFCNYSPKRGEFSSSHSSDDDGIKLLAKQLRQHGQQVRYIPPRKSVINGEKKIFQRIGQKEREALQYFEYLKVRICLNTLINFRRCQRTLADYYQIQVHQHRIGQSNLNNFLVKKFLLVVFIFIFTYKNF